MESSRSAAAVHGSQANTVLQDYAELAIEWAGSVVAVVAEKTSKILFKASILGVIGWVLLSVAITTYASFRFVYLPTSSHLAPVHFNFNTPDGLPEALVQLVPDDSWLLRGGQTYDVSLVVEVPESDLNNDLGIVMVGLELHAGTSGKVRASQRLTMLRYKSWLSRLLETVFWAPLLVLQYTDESQSLYVFMFEDFIDDATHPVTHASVKLSKPLQVYRAQLRFDAHFTGLRHLMYWYPILTGGVIVLSMFLSEVLALAVLYGLFLCCYAGGGGDTDDLDGDDQDIFKGEDSDEGEILHEAIDSVHASTPRSRQR